MQLLKMEKESNIQRENIYYFKILDRKWCNNSLYEFIYSH